MCSIFQAKSEAQLASEKAWLSAERVWLVHKGGFAAARLQRGTENGGEGEGLGEGKCRVKLDYGGEILEVEEEDVEKVRDSNLKPLSLWSSHLPLWWLLLCTLLVM